MTNEQIENLKREAAKQIAGIRWDKYEKPNGNTQCREEYAHYLSAQWIDEASAIIDHLHSQNRLLADGCVGVPREPTQGMIGAGLTELMTKGSSDALKRMYKAMITAQTEKREGE